MSKKKLSNIKHEGVAQGFKKEFLGIDYMSGNAIWDLLDSKTEELVGIQVRDNKLNSYFWFEYVDE